jgi:16S rRNA (uracil1498-N3)-methyltransferase
VKELQRTLVARPAPDNRDDAALPGDAYAAGIGIGYDGVMAIRNPSAQRLFLENELKEGLVIPCSREHANYLRNVLRLAASDQVLVFNGRDGEWCARLVETGKRGCALQPVEQVRPQETGPDLDYLFAPLKRARLDYMVQKATELGAARLWPVLTRRTIAERVNVARMRANVIEAAEQCGILRLPELREPDRLERIVARWDASRPLVFCDESAEVKDPIAALRAVPRGPVAVLLGPEGGFSAEERALLLDKPYTVRLSLGPRVLRADTAAVAALALVNAAVGDWSE